MLLALAIRQPLCDRRPAMRAGDHTLRNAAELSESLREGDAGTYTAKLGLHGGTPSPYCGMDGVDGIVKLVERIAGHAPAVIHVEGADERVFVDWIVGEVGAALHVRLPGKNPDIADENVTDSEPFAAYGERDVIRTAGGNAVEARLEMTVFSLAYEAAFPSVKNRSVATHTCVDFPFTIASAANLRGTGIINAALQHHVRE